MGSQSLFYLGRIVSECLRFLGIQVVSVNKGKKKMLGMCHWAVATYYYSKQGQRMLKRLPQHNNNEKEQTNNGIKKRTVTAITEEQLDISDLRCYHATMMANIFF